MVIVGSCKHIAGFLGGLLEGKFDGIVQEIDAQEMKSMSGKAIFEYPKFKMGDVAMMFAKERMQQQNVTTYAAPSQQIVVAIATNEEEHDLPPQQQEEADEPEEEAAESSHDRKERILKEAREKHVTNAMNQQARLVIRPSTKDGYADLFRESALIENRSSLSPAHSQDLWRHGWIYDSGSDNEPGVSASSRKGCGRTRHSQTRP